MVMIYSPVIALWRVTCFMNMRVGSIGRLWYERSRIPGEQRFRAAAAARRRMGLPFPNEPTAFQILLKTRLTHEVGLIFLDQQLQPLRLCNVGSSCYV
jgi:hypothetical protein